MLKQKGQRALCKLGVCSKALFCMAFALCLFVLPVLAQQAPSASMAPALAIEKNVRVGYIEGYGLTVQNGIPVGYVADYLDEITKHTGFSFEYIAGDWQSNMDALQRGEIDLICPITKQPGLESDILFSQYEMGFDYLALYARAEDERLYFDDFANFNQMKVGSFTVNDSFERYKSDNGFSADYVFYNTVDEIRAALASGEIDTYILESSAQYGDVKMVAKLDVFPFYVGAQKGNTELMAPIDAAMREIRRQDIYYAAKLQEKYYGKDLIGAPAFSLEETWFIESAQEVRVAFAPDLYAVEWYDEKEKTYTGILPDLLRLIEEKSGLNINFVPVNSYTEACEYFESGKVDAITGCIYDEHEADEEYSDVIFRLPLVFTTPVNKNLAQGGRVAILQQYETYEPLLKTRFPSFRFEAYEASGVLLEAVESGRLEAGLVNSISLNKALALGVAPELEFSAPADVTAEVRLLVSKELDTRFISIFDKTLRRISTEEENAIVMKNTAAPEVRVTATQVLRHYAYPIAAGVFLVLLLIAAAVLVVGRRNRAKLDTLAYVDPLTGRDNFNKFKLEATKLLAGDSGTFEIWKLDVDRFKLFNELFGLESGDELLRLISDCIWENETVQAGCFARIASDEFVLLRRFYADEDSMAAQREFEEKVHQRLPVAYDLHLNYGRYVLETGETDLGAIYEKVNFAHRMAKETPGIRFCDYDNRIKQALLRTQRIENSMERALVEGQFLLYLQAKYRLADEKIAGAEALVRWRDDTGELVFPGEFIPIFEKNGFITRLDFYMFTKTCQLVQSWLDAGKKPVCISVNFSRLHLANKNFVTGLCEIADRFAVPHHLLEIELTENTILGNEEALQSLLGELHEAGFTLSIDDFGTGYSALSLLKNLPVDVLKMDRGFFVDAVDTKRTRAVLQSIFEMARQLAIKTVAEGVETAQMIEILRELGCDMVQGYYYARPQPAKELTEKLEAAE